MAKYYVIPTNIGRAKLANATITGQLVVITQMAVGDGGGQEVAPTGAMTTLVNEVYRAGVNNMSIDPDNPAHMNFQLVIPVAQGGWFIREVGIFDSAGDLIAVGNTPESYKPQLAEGAGSDFDVNLILEVAETSAITVVVNPAMVLATKRDIADHAAIIAGPNSSGHAPAFGSAPLNAGLYRDPFNTGALKWASAPTPVFLSEPIDFNQMFTNGEWCLESTSSQSSINGPTLNGGFLRVAADTRLAANGNPRRAYQSYTVWFGSGNVPNHGVTYTRGLHGDSDIWSPWQHNGWLPDYRRVLTYTVPTETNKLTMPVTGEVVAELRVNYQTEQTAQVIVQQGTSAQVVMASLTWDGSTNTVRGTYSFLAPKGAQVWTTGHVVSFKIVPCVGEII